jgi:hypothetical protein
LLFRLALRRVSLAILISPRFVRLMTADDAAGSGAEKPMVHRIVPGNAADKGTSYAAFGVSRRRHAYNRQCDCGASNNLIHEPLLECGSHDQRAAAAFVPSLPEPPCSSRLSESDRRRAEISTHLT